MTPQVTGLFYSTKLQSSITWWKMSHHFASKKVLRWVDRAWSKSGVLKGAPLCAETFAPKFVDPPDVDFAIKDLLKGRRIGAYTVNRQTTYEDLRMLKSVVRPQDYMLSLDVESEVFHVPIHPKHRKFF
jgi:hypothetical protein